MKKSVLFLVLMVLLIQSTLAFKTLEIEDEPIENVLIGSKEATFWVNLTNNGDFTDTFRISTLDIQWDIEPKQVTVNARSSNIFKFIITPFTEREPALYGVSVKFISDNDESIKDSHLFKIDVLSYENMISPTFVLPKEIDSNRENLFSLNLLNDHNIHLEDIKVVLESDFFSYERELEFLPYEEIKEDFLVSFDGSVEEGQYPVKVKIFYKDEFAKEVTTNMNIGYFPDVTEVRTPESSFLVERTTIVKINEGNLISHESYKKDFTWFEKLFTYTDPKPTSIEKDGKYTYIWEFDLDTNEEVTIFIQTNYRYLVLIIILVVLLLIWLYYLTKRELTIKKKVTTIKRSKEGYSTLNIQIIIKNRSRQTLHEIKILDKLIGITEEPNFGMIKPDSIKKEMNSVKMIWNLPILRKGEERIIYYQTRLRLRIIGNFVIPVAVAKYRLGNKIRYVRTKAIKLFS